MFPLHVPFFLTRFLQASRPQISLFMSEDWMSISIAKPSAPSESLELMPLEWMELQRRSELMRLRTPLQRHQKNLLLLLSLSLSLLLLLLLPSSTKWMFQQQHWQSFLNATSQKAQFSSPVVGFGPIPNKWQKSLSMIHMSILLRQAMLWVYCGLLNASSQHIRRTTVVSSLIGDRHGLRNIASYW